MNSMVTEKKILTVVWRNVRKMRSRERQSEIMDWIERSNSLDYECMDGRGLKKVGSGSIPAIGEVIESDHAVIRVDIEWKGVMKQCKKKRKAQKKRCLNKQKWEVFGRWMNGKEFENMSEMNSMMAKGCEMEEDNW